MISGNVPQSLSLLAKTGFLTTARKPVPDWAPIARMVDMTAKNQTLVDLGGAPMPTRQRGKFNAQDFIEKSMAIEPLDWELPVGIEGNAIKDDQTGKLLEKVRAAGSNFQRHIAQTAFQALNDGDGTNYGTAYDGLNFYSNSHLDKGAQYVTLQDNLDSLTLSLTNFETVRVKAKLARDDQGEFTDYDYNLLVVDPTNERNAANITGNPLDATTGNRAINPYAGKTNHIVSPKLDTGAWILVASSEVIKPIIIVMREAPHLEDAWKDPEAPKGGMYWFKFTARYNFYYGDWRTAFLGHS